MGTSSPCDFFTHHFVKRLFFEGLQLRRARGRGYIPAQTGWDMTPRGRVLLGVCLANVLVLGGVVHAYLTTVMSSLVLGFIQTCLFSERLV